MPLPTLCGLLGLILIALVCQDAFEVMLLPRRVPRRARFIVLYFRLMWPLWRGLARRLPLGRRERLLSHFGPLSMIGLLAGWSFVLVLGFGLLEYALQQSAARAPLAAQVYMSGVTFFTLGYGDVVPHGAAARLVAVLEAGGGLGFIAVVISYLPVLYQLFARREAHVLLLDGRAGSPPTATTLIRRHAEAGGLPQLDTLLREWETWGAELLESHLSYPMLVYYRSQRDNQSWLAAIAAAMDCCALILVGVRALPPFQARMTFAMCRQIVVEMALSFQIRPSRYEGADRLPPASYDRMVAALADAGVAWEGGADGPRVLLALRATYEPLLDGIARHLLLELPGWLPDEGSADHWQTGHRGTLARRLIEQLTDRTAPPAGPAPPDLWRAVRRRLRTGD